MTFYYYTFVILEVWFWLNKDTSIWIINLTDSSPNHVGFG